VHPADRPVEPVVPGQHLRHALAQDGERQRGPNGDVGRDGGGLDGVVLSDGP
jgi:hypothetical protein